MLVRGNTNKGMGKGVGGGIEVIYAHNKSWARLAIHKYRKTYRQTDTNSYRVAVLLKIYLVQ